MTYRGADISMLPVLESHGAKFGPTGDLPATLAGAGCNLFRIRVFVDPSHDYASTYGAVQDLPAALQLAKRVKAAGGAILLDLHYSDTWADPSHQTKPRAWADLHGQALRQRVQDYTTQTLQSFRQADVLPEMVQVGNEITPGMLWPDGQLYNRHDNRTDAQAWDDFGELINAGIRGVRAVQDAARPIRIVIHIHGGGERGLPASFFEKLAPRVKDFDVIGLSFYPGEKETLPQLKENLARLIDFHRDILIAETAYPNRALKDVAGPGLEFPQTPDGQRQFLLALRQTLADVPEGRGKGFIYWYPEGIQLPKLWVWRDGGLATFDDTGRPLPAVDAFAAN